MPNPRRTAVLVAGLALAAVAIPLVRWGMDVQARVRYARRQAEYAPTAVRTLGTLASTLRESSGLGVSRAHPGVLWTHNDSGDGPRFYAIDLEGRLTATWQVAGASAVDWEDADLGPCPGGEPSSCLYLADTGDNALRRDTLTVYVVPEPDPANEGRTVRPLGRLRFVYPDSPHDVEAFAVHPSGDLVFVTKGRTRPILAFTLPAAAAAAAVGADTVATLAPGAPVPVEPDWGLERVITGASFHPAGSTLAVRTYSEVFFLPWPPPAGGWGEPRSCFLGGLEPSGEAIGWQDERMLLLTSEADGSRPGALTLVRCPEGNPPE